MYYRPKFSNGKLVPLNWPLTTYRLLNTIAWPLEDDVSLAVRLFDRLCWLVGFCIFVMHNDAELRYIIVESKTLDEMLKGMPTYFVLVELFLRAFPLGLTKNSLRRFLQKYYAEVYIPESTHPQLYRRLQRKLLPITIYSVFYTTALCSFLLIPIYSIATNRREMLYQMTPPYDYSPIYVYVPLVLSSTWVGVMIVAMLFGEAFIIGEVTMHLKGRFELLREDLLNANKRLLKHNDAAHIAEDFSREVAKILERNAALSQFITEFQKEFSYRIFIMMSFSAGLLCVLGFIVYTNPANSIGFLLWMCAKVMEMLVIGANGSELISSTDAVSSIYYECNWETIVMHSTNTHANVQLMKMITVAIATNQNNFFLTGLNFFTVSLHSVLNIIRGAGSYFTCLIALR